MLSEFSDEIADCLAGVRGDAWRRRRRRDASEGRFEMTGDARVIHDVNTHLAAAGLRATIVVRDLDSGREVSTSADQAMPVGLRGEGSDRLRRAHPHQ